MSDNKYLKFAQAMLKNEMNLDIESANEILEEGFKKCREVNLLEHDEKYSYDNYVVLDNKIRFIHALKTICLDEIGVDNEDIRLYCINEDNSSASFTQMPEAFGKKVTGVVNIDYETLMSASYFELARLLYHEFNHVKLLKDFCEGRKVPSSMGLGSSEGCLFQILKYPLMWSYMSNKNERLCNLKSHVETKKWLEIAKKLNANETKLEIEETNLRICEKTDNFTYFLGNLCLGKMWGIVLRKIFQLFFKILDGKYDVLNGVDFDDSEESLKAIIDSFINRPVEDEFDKESMVYLVKKILQLMLPHLNVGLDEYLVSFEDVLDEMKVVDFKLSKEYTGIKDSGKLKYHVVIPSSYLQLSCKDLYDKLLQDMEKIKVQADLYRENQERNVV